MNEKIYFSAMTTMALCCVTSCAALGFNWMKAQDAIIAGDWRTAEKLVLDDPPYSPNPYGERKPTPNYTVEIRNKKGARKALDFFAAYFECYSQPKSAADETDCRIDVMQRVRVLPKKISASREFLAFLNDKADEVRERSAKHRQAADKSGLSGPEFEKWSKLLGTEDPGVLREWAKRGPRGNPLLWKNAGFSPGTARDFDRAQISPDTAAVWVEAEFTPDEATTWTKHEISVENATVYRAAGITKNDFRYAKSAGAPMSEYVQWRENGFEPRDIATWKQNGTSLPEASRYVEMGLTYRDISMLKSLSLSLGDYPAWQESGFDISAIRNLRQEGVPFETITLARTYEIKPSDIQRAREHEVYVDGLVAWIQHGFTVDEAFQWSAYGFSPSSIKQSKKTLKQHCKSIAGTAKELVAASPFDIAGKCFRIRPARRIQLLSRSVGLYGGGSFVMKVDFGKEAAPNGCFDAILKGRKQYKYVSTIGSSKIVHNLRAVIVNKRGCEDE